MKIPDDNKYFKTSFYAVMSLIIFAAAVIVMINLNIVTKYIWDLVSLGFELISPIIAGIIISFLLDPVVEFYEERIGSPKKYKFKKRIRGTAAAYITVAAVIVIIITAVYKSLGAADISGLSDAVNGVIDDVLNYMEKLQKTLNEMGIFSVINSILNEFMGYIISSLRKTAFNAASSITALGSFFVKAGLGIALSFYFLSEKERMIYRLKDMAFVFLPEKYAKKLILFFGDINFVFSGYISGQITDALVMAALFSISFWAAGIKYAFVIGVISGLFNIIPYIGAVAAFILSVFASLVSGDPTRAIYAAAVVIAVQQIDGLIISPKIMGQSVKLHPVFVVVSLFIFGSLWGFSGMLIAVPVMALIKINFDRFYEERKNKTNKNFDLRN
jgi:predicted PurR-regulated permease PerM